MRMFKKMMACLLVVAMLASMASFVSAEDSTVLGGVVSHSITEEAETGFGLAFRIKMNVKGAQMNELQEFVNTTATAMVGGVEYDVVKMGAVMTNQIVHLNHVNDLTLEDVNEAHTVLDVTAQYLYTTPAADYCEFAVRIINLPLLAMGRAVACRPYVVLQDANGAETVVYSDGDIFTYNAVYYSKNESERPVLSFAPVKLNGRIAVSATAEYRPYVTTNYAEAFEVNMTLVNECANAKSSAGDYIIYACKDVAGNILSNEIVVVDALNPGASKEVTFYAPVGTATIEAVKTNLNYVALVTLPAIGTDIDVAKKKNRIRVYETSATCNEDGTILVSLTFKNYSTNWITEETDYIEYTYYNANGTKIKTETLYIGVIDTKKNPIKTYTFTLPSTAVSVKITKSRITYWTEWA